MTVQLGGNAGSMIGNALFGGKTSKMAEQAVLNEAIKESEAAEDPDERLKLFAAALRKRGLEGYAQKAESQLLSRQKTLSEINEKKAEAELKQVAYANRFSALKSKFPKISDEEARAIANDATLFNDTIKDKDISTSVVSVGGRKKLINSKTGDTIKELGADTTGRGSGTGAGKGKAPAGYRWAADGESLEPIPGGPKDTESKASGDLQKNLRDTQQSKITAQEALTLLDSGVPTGSGAGKLVDQAAAFVGKSTAGAEGAAKLKVLAGRLTSSVPRMQGPQSDRDVKLYQEMAGQVGNEDLPLSVRRASLVQMIQLNALYEDMYKQQLEEQSRRAPGDAGPPTRANTGTPAPRGTQPTISGWN
jgi:hypothetical protein